MHKQPKPHRHLAYGAYLLALLLFGSNGFYVAHLALPSSQIVLGRTLIGGVLLTLLVFLRGGFDWVALRKDLLPLLGGGVMLAVNWIALFQAFQLLGVSLATFVYYIGPMLVLLLSPVLLHEPLTHRKGIAIGIVLAGFVCISGSILGAKIHPLGLIVAMLSACSYAALIVLNKQIHHTKGLQTAALELDIACLLLLVYTLCTAGVPVFTMPKLPCLLGLGVLNTGLAYFLYFYGLQKLPAQSVALLGYLEPVSALGFSVLLLGERLTLLQCLGATLILGGAVLAEGKK